MAKLAGVNHQDAVRAVQKSGFQIIRQGKHIVMCSGDRLLTIPRHNLIKAFTMGGSFAMQVSRSKNFAGCFKTRS